MLNSFTKKIIIGAGAFIILCSYYVTNLSSFDTETSKVKKKQAETPAQEYTLGEDGMWTYYQTDYPDLEYGYYADGSPKYLPATGCGPTSFSMCASILTNSQIDPPTVIGRIGNRYYVLGAGTAYSFFEGAAIEFDLPYNVTSTRSWDTVCESLRNGIPVISSQTRGLFTKGGHFIVLAGINDEGNIHVKDPNGTNAVDRGYNERWFTRDEIDTTAYMYFIFTPK